MILIGELSLWVALLMAIWGAAVSFAGGSLGRRDLVDSGERAIYATLVMVALASLGLWTAIFTHDFSFKYVASFTSANLPKAYLFTSFWAGQAGSLLFWCLILSIYSAIAIWTNRSRNRALMPYVSGTLAIVLGFRWPLFLALAIEVVPALQLFPSWTLAVAAMATTETRKSSQNSKK